MVVLNLNSGAVYAAPALNARQIGNMQCNMDRDQVVKNLATATKKVGQLANSTTAECVSQNNPHFSVELTSRNN